MISQLTRSRPLPDDRAWNAGAVRVLGENFQRVARRGFEIRKCERPNTLVVRFRRYFPLVSKPLVINAVVLDVEDFVKLWRTPG